MVICLTVGLIKKTRYSDYIKMNDYFPKLYVHFGGDISVTPNFSNYATKADLNEEQELICLN